MSNHKPATALPWTVMEITSTVVGADARPILHPPGAYTSNATYIAHSANAYPHLVEALHEARKFISAVGNQGTKTAEQLLREWSALLRELGEL